MTSPEPEGEEMSACAPCLCLDCPVGYLLLPSVELGNTTEQGTLEEEDCKFNTENFSCFHMFWKDFQKGAMQKILHLEPRCVVEEEIDTEESLG